MPRRNRNRNRNRSNPLGTRVERVSGRTLFTLAGGSSTVIPISPASFSRCAAIADVFQFYRFTDLKVHVYPNDAAVTVGYAPGAAFDTVPATSGQILELPLAVNHGFLKASDTTLHVPRSELLPDAQIPWFKTIPGTPATQFEIQGNVYVVTPGAAGSIHGIEWTCEFQSWNLAANSPLETKGAGKTPGSDDSVVLLEKKPDVLVIGGVTYKKSLA